MEQVIPVVVEIANCYVIIVVLGSNTDMSFKVDGVICNEADAQKSMMTTLKLYEEN